MTTKKNRLNAQTPSSLSDLGTKVNFEHSSPFEKGGLRGILHIKAGVLLIKSPYPLYKRGKMT